jgi:hypothetical protein
MPYSKLPTAFIIQIEIAARVTLISLPYNFLSFTLKVDDRQINFLLVFPEKTHFEKKENSSHIVSP